MKKLGFLTFDKKINLNINDYYLYYLNPNFFEQLNNKKIFLFLGYNLRLESPILNIKLRKKSMKENVLYLTIGSNFNDNLNSVMLGLNINTLIKYFQGKLKICNLILKNVKKIQNEIVSLSNLFNFNMFLIGNNVLNRVDNKNVFRLIEKYNKKNIVLNNRYNNNSKNYLSFFFINFFLINVFGIADLIFFYVFFESLLIPMFLLIGIWGSRNRKIHAAYQFFLYTLLGSVIMLLGILYIYINVGSLNIYEITNYNYTVNEGRLLWIAFFASFAVKVPMIPVHIWLPEAHVEAPTAGSVLLAGILLKTAAYGLLRFGIPFFPNASADFAPIAMWLGIFGVFYGAFLAFAQTDIKRLIAYTSVSHMGFVLIGIYAGNLLTLQGLVIQMLAHGICAGGLFILCGQLYERLHTRDLREMGGLWGRFSYLPALMMFFAAALLGLPSTGNFVGEFLILLGAFKVVPVITKIGRAHV